MASRSATTLSDSRLAPVWSALRAGGRTALIPYLTAGYPDRAASEAALRAADGLADILEVGVPFSDPTADGPVIAAAAYRAIHHGGSLRAALDVVRSIRRTSDAPLVLFTYYNPIMAFGERELPKASHL